MTDPLSKFPEHIRMLIKADLRGDLPCGFGVAHVLHDDRCDIWSGGDCSCDPDIEIELPNPNTKKDGDACTPMTKF